MRPTQDKGIGGPAHTHEQPHDDPFKNLTSPHVKCTLLMERPFHADGACPRSRSELDRLVHAMSSNAARTLSTAIAEQYRASRFLCTCPGLLPHCHTDVAVPGLRRC